MLLFSSEFFALFDCRLHAFVNCIVNRTLCSLQNKLYWRKEGNMNAKGHTHSHGGTDPITEGRTIHWASHYDLAVRLLTFGKESSLRDQTIRQAAISRGATVLGRRTPPGVVSACPPL